MSPYAPFTAPDAAAWIAEPSASDDKYTRGVLGVATGSDRYPGAAVLGVEAALRTGVGMVRYAGPARATELVLARRPEAVPGRGRVQAWLIGSGMDAADGERAPLGELVAEGVPVVLDGGALGLVRGATGPVVLTPHYRELARLLGADAEEIAADPATWAARASQELGATVLLKGATTYVHGARPDGPAYAVTCAPAWLATAGAGDALGGVLGALVATHSHEIADDPTVLAALAATAAVLHGDAATRASAGGPFTILDLCSRLPEVVRDLLSRR